MHQVISAFFEETDYSDWSIMAALKHISEHSMIYPKDTTSLLEHLKEKFLSVSRQSNILSHARNKATTIYSSFDKTIERRPEIRNWLQTIEKKEEMESQKLVYRESMKSEVLNDKLAVALETRLKRKLERDTDALPAKRLADEIYHPDSESHQYSEDDGTLPIVKADRTDEIDNEENIWAEERIEDPFSTESELEFISKLRKVMVGFQESKRPLDKAFAKIGILRLSSRQNVSEPSGMRADAMKALSTEDREALKRFLSLPKVDGIPNFEGKTVDERLQNVYSFSPSRRIERTTMRIHELFLNGLDGREELTRDMNERTFTAKYIVPLNDWPFQDQKHISSFWCEKGDKEIVHDKNIENNLWDGVFLDDSMELKPHIVLHEVSGGTEGCSMKKLASDLFKLAKGMKKHLQRLGRSVNGNNIDDARRIRVCGVQYVGNYAFYQAMCALTPDLYVMWEWGASILPRSVQQMGQLNKTIRLIYTVKAICSETKELICKTQEEVDLIAENDILTGCSSPIKSDNLWQRLFHPYSMSTS